MKIEEAIASILKNKGFKSTLKAFEKEAKVASPEMTDDQVSALFVKDLFSCVKPGF